MCVCKPLKDHAVAAMKNSQHIRTLRFSLSFDAAMAIMLIIIEWAILWPHSRTVLGSKPPSGLGLSVCLCGVCLFFPCLGVFSLDIWPSFYSPKTCS